MSHRQGIPIYMLLIKIVASSEASFFVKAYTCYNIKIGLLFSSVGGGGGGCEVLHFLIAFIQY